MTICHICEVSIVEVGTYQELTTLKCEEAWRQK